MWFWEQRRLLLRGDGGRRDRKIEGSGFDSWRNENTLDEPPEDDGRKHCGDWVGCAVGRGVGICGISSSEQMPGEMKKSFEFIMAPEDVALEHCEINNAAGFSVEFERVDDGENSKLSLWMEIDQWRRLWHRTGHSCIEKCNMNVLTAIRERVLGWAGHVAIMDNSEICAKLRCRGLQWWRVVGGAWRERSETNGTG